MLPRPYGGFHVKKFACEATLPRSQVFAHFLNNHVAAGGRSDAETPKRFVVGKY